MQCGKSAQQIADVPNLCEHEAPGPGPGATHAQRAPASAAWTTAAAPARLRATRWTDVISSNAVQPSVPQSVSCR